MQRSRSTVGGVLTGSVRAIELPRKPTDKITVVMDLQKSTHDIIKQDSVANIQTEGLLGNEYISISFGSAEALNVKDGDTIGSQPPLVIADLIAKTDAILDSSKGAIDNVSAATANLKSISSKINDGHGTVGALINDRTMYTQLDQTAAGMNATMTHAQAESPTSGKHGSAETKFPAARLFQEAPGYDIRLIWLSTRLQGCAAASPLRTFTYEPRIFFTKIDTAEMKNQGSLSTAGESFLRAMSSASRLWSSIPARQAIRTKI